MLLSVYALICSERWYSADKSTYSRACDNVYRSFGVHIRTLFASVVHLESKAEISFIAQKITTRTWSTRNTGANLVAVYRPESLIGVLMSPQLKIHPCERDPMVLRNTFEMIVSTKVITSCTTSWIIKQKATNTMRNEKRNIGKTFASGLFGRVARPQACFFNKGCLDCSPLSNISLGVQICDLKHPLAVHSWMSNREHTIAVKQIL